MRAGERGCGVTQPLLNVGRPKYDRNRESETQPELVAKHGDGVASVTVMAPLSVWHLMTGMRAGRFPVRLILVHIPSFWRVHPMGRATVVTLAQNKRHRDC